MNPGNAGVELETTSHEICEDLEPTSRVDLAVDCCAVEDGDIFEER